MNEQTKTRGEHAVKFHRRSIEGRKAEVVRRAKSLFAAAAKVAPERYGELLAAFESGADLRAFAGELRELEGAARELAATDEDYLPLARSLHRGKVGLADSDAQSGCFWQTK